MGAFTMPSLGADMDAGTVTRWLIAPGDTVHRGDVVAVVDTEKSEIEVEVFEDGIVQELVVPEGEEVPVGTVLARIVPAAAGRPPPATPPGAPVPTTGHAPGGATERVHSPVVRRLAAELGVDVADLAGSGPAGTVTRADVESAARRGPVPGTAVPAPNTVPGRAARSSPYARRLAAELGVDVVRLAGTGPAGAVVARDVRPGAAATPARREPEPGPVEDRPARLRRAIGALMARSKREIPHYYLATTIDLSRARAWLDEANASRPVTGRLVMGALLLAATARAVATVPEVNGFFRDGSFTPSPSVHLGVAISLRTGGVIAPAIHEAQDRTPDELMEALRDLVGRARTGVLRGSELADPTLTVTNLGDLGVDLVHGVIFPPQVALVGFGRVAERPMIAGGQVVARTAVTATLAADHRVSDGHRGGRYLAEIDRLLQRPEEL